MQSKANKINAELLTLKNVAKATYQDLQLLGITTIRELAKAGPDEFYSRLQTITLSKHDPCVWDVLASAIHEARSGEKQPW